MMDEKKFKNEVKKQRLEQSILEASPDFVAAVDSVGQLLYINRRGRILLGMAEDEDLSDMNVLDLYPSSAQTIIIDEAMPTALKKGEWRGKVTLLTRSGSELDVLVVITANKVTDEESEFFSIFAREIEGQKFTSQAIQLFAGVFENTKESIMITDANRNIQAVNPTFTIVTGYSPEEVIGKNPRILQSGRHDAEFYKRFWEVLDKTGQWQGEIWNRRKSGELYPEWLTISAVRNDKGEVTNYVGVFSDITTIKLAENRLAYLANHDPLTGLPNRMLFQDRFNLAAGRASRTKGIVCLLFIDLDNFKPINDALGHNIGDILLRAVSERLRGCVREEDTVARVGGDEFMVILTDIPNKDATSKVAQKILDSLLHPFILEGNRIKIGASIGISFYPGDSTDMGVLIKYSDLAMYRAKEQGGNRYQFYNS
jgi:diguanylate cyclase (GGDEF)-like protein/PAS domain S-box-containing protein